MVESILAEKELAFVHELLNANRGEKVFAREMLHEGKYWIEHIRFLDSICNTVGCNPDEFERRMFVMNDVLTNFCTFLNWLTCIENLSKNVSNREIANFVSKHFHWPEHISETFINCVRNPTVHIGRAYPWGEYEGFRNTWKNNIKYHEGEFTFLGSVDLNTLEASLGLYPELPNFKIRHKVIMEDGYGERRNRDPNEREVVFFLPGMMSHAVNALTKVYDDMRAFSEEQLQHFDVLKNELCITRVPAPENMGL